MLGCSLSPDSPNATGGPTPGWSFNSSAYGVEESSRSDSWERENPQLPDQTNALAHQHQISIPLLCRRRAALSATTARFDVEQMASAQPGVPLRGPNSREWHLPKLVGLHTENATLLQFKHQP